MVFAIYSVPISFGLAMIPHLTKTVIIKQDNRMHAGRTNLADVEGKLTKDQFALVGRLGAAHQNGLETLAMYSSGVAACLATGAPLDVVTTACQVHIAARVAFYVLYAAKPVFFGLPRSLAWATSMLASVFLWATAAKSYGA